MRLILALSLLPHCDRFSEGNDTNHDSVNRRPSHVACLFPGVGNFRPARSGIKKKSNKISYYDIIYIIKLELNCFFNDIKNKTI